MLRSLVTALMLLTGASAVAAAKPSEEEAVRRVILSLPESWRKADAAMGDAALDPEFRLLSYRDNVASDDTAPPPKLPLIDVASRAAMMSVYGAIKPGSWDDRLSNLVIHVSPAGVATGWANYRFYIDGKQTHCGAPALTLYKRDGKWRIVEFADTHHWAQAGEPGGCKPPAAP